MPGERYETNLHKAFIKSFGRGQFPHKSVDSSFIMTSMDNELADLCGNRLLQNDFINTLYERKTSIKKRHGIEAGQQGRAKGMGGEAEEGGGAHV